MHLSCLADLIGRYATVSDAEAKALESLATGVRTIRRSAVIRREREASHELFVVLRGWLFCSTLMEDGRRQIIRFHFRGDLLGVDSLGFASATSTLTALTEAEICLLDPVAFGRLFAEQPRLSALLYAAAQIDQVALTDRLTSLGRSSALGRVAALLLWVVDRLRTSDPAQGDRFTLPMTQEEIGDATGLTAVHVNRTLRVLEEQGLIERTRSTLRLISPDRLARIANQPNRRLQLMPEFLPAG